MRVYTFEDLYRDHNVNDLAAAYARLGAIAADSSHGAPIDDWWAFNGAGVVLRPIRYCAGDYVNSLDYSRGVERFAWMHFKTGRLQRKGAVR